MNRGKTVKIDNVEYTLTTKETKSRKLRGIDNAIGVELFVEVFNNAENRTMFFKEIKALGIEEYLIKFSKDSFNGLNLSNWYIDNVSEKYDAIIQDKLNLEEDIASIQMQLDTAKDQVKFTGVQADVNWYRKAKQALAMKQMELKRLNMLEVELRSRRKAEQQKKRIEKNNSIAKVFTDIAYKKLDSKVFDDIYEKAKEIIEEKNSAD
ncbi:MULTISPECIES: hypothetical protein [Clostridium]|uniref:Phage protein n=1 Tax=Clostridium carnis TaxID=1530 RepID=A0ABY6SRT4_9CLOT|nr:hypothetical protein [Clostridium carnis]CAI3560905.1 conserved hypothetical protein [Clostridium neonatale]CAI3562259.1 conserved hypothetical protein [Clostridium neonatale]CAI3583192.1 conserved hypothetical protein [Clostridium neonatale]CAI3622956.1 conserved hypothetical protein [Clostridium neonatale]CAI3675155.1 conserved hypothetical protein [Clostridium neonatale]